jgi:hypothetical protein
MMVARIAISLKMAIWGKNSSLKSEYVYFQAKKLPVTEFCRSMGSQFILQQLSPETHKTVRSMGSK